MPNARPTPRLRLTPETRELLRGMTEAVENGTAPFITHEAVLAARAFREIERLEAVLAEAERWQAGYEALRDALIVVHPTQNGHVRVLMSSDGPAETIMTPDEAKDLARRLLWAVGMADAVRMRELRELDDEVGVGLTDPGGDEA